MQIVEPMDAADLLREDLAELMPDVEVCVSPAKGMRRPNTVAITQIGGTPASAVSLVYDLSIDARAETPARAMALANRANGIVCSLPMRRLKSGRDWKSVRAMVPYENPDPSAPLVPRCTFGADLWLRGKPTI